MRHLDLFSGIGGFSLAAMRVWGEDHESIAFCEIEPYCQKVLAKHWPDTPCHDDIRTLKGDQFGAVDLITGGFPCQPYSTAGLRRGSEDDRHLWPEMLRVIREAQPRWIVGENVRGLTNWNDGVVFDEVLSDLEAEGYAAQSFLVPACAVDAPHRRDRVWIVARDTKGNNIGEVGRFQEGTNADAGRICKDVADTDECRLQGGGQSIRVNQEPSRERHGKSTGIHPRELNWWSTEPNVGRVANGVSNRVDRLRGLGNAIVPQVAERIMAAIKMADEHYATL